MDTLAAAKTRLDRSSYLFGFFFLRFFQVLTVGGSSRADDASAGGGACGAVLGGLSCRHVVCQALELRDVLQG